jgi:hypothetical protein
MIFFNRKSKDQPRPESKESPDELANRLQREGRVADLEKELQKYSPADLSAKDRESYYHLWGITAFQRQDRAEAFRRFKLGFESCPDSQPLLFSIGQEHEHRREVDRMFECFDRCSFPTCSSAFMLAAARYAYLWNRPNKGTKYIRPIAEAYFKLGIADDHFVYVRGLPFFGQTWTYLVAFAALQGGFSETDDYLNRAAQKLSGYDFDPTRRFYDCVKKDDYAPAIADLEARLAKWDARFPSGYTRTQLAALKARSAKEAPSALLSLQNIPLAPNDFPWLADILTIHRAWAFRRGGDTEAEAAEVDRFLARQTMLFEPDHAVAFAFLPYQEYLKLRYQHRDANS